MQKQLINKESSDKPKPKKSFRHRHHESINSMQLPYLVQSKKEEEIKEEHEKVNDCDDKNNDDMISPDKINEPVQKFEIEPVQVQEEEIKDIDQDIKLLSLLKREYEKEKETTVLQLGNLFSEYNQNKIEIRKMTKDNKIFYEQIQDIRNEPNSRTKLSMIFKVKHHQLNLSISNYEEIIKRQTIELSHLAKAVKENKAEKEFIEKLYQQLNSNKEGNIIPNINNELKQINDKGNELMQIIKQLHKISVLHKNCERNNKNLSNTLNLLTNQYENDRAASSSNKISRRDMLIQNNDFSFVSLNNDNRMPFNLMKVRLGSPSQKKIPYFLSSTKKNGQYSERIKKKEINKSMPMINPNITNHSDLFDNEEKTVLIKWIPSQKLKDYEMRFNTIKEKKKEIELKLLSKSASTKSGIRFKKDKNEEIIKRLQEQKKEITELRNDYCLIKQKVNYTKNKIQDTKTLIQKTFKNIVQKDNDYYILLNHYNMIVKKFNFNKKKEEED